MKLHRNSQKRFYNENGVYFVTTNTHEGYPYFNEDLFCELFVENLKYSRTLKGFEIFAYKINPEHVHLLIQPGKKYNYSQIMGSLKRNFSRDCNDLMEMREFVRSHKGDDSNRRLYGLDDEFKRLHAVLDKLDFYNHLQYIQNQAIKHKLKENKYCFVNQEVCV